MKLADIKNVIFFIVLCVIIITCFSLGVWQLDRYSQKKHQQHDDTPSVDTEVEIGHLINAESNDEVVGKTVNIDGDFIAGSTFKLDNRSFNSVYGVELFTLFREQTSNKVYLVNMGWLEVANKRDRLALKFDFSGKQQIQATIANIPSRPPFISTENFRDDNLQDLWLFVNREYLEKQHSTAIESLVLNNMKPADNLKYRTSDKKDNAYMHMLYAIQWFLFSLFALFGLIKIYR